MKAAPRAPPSGTATTIDGQARAVGQRLHPRGRPACRRRWRRCGGSPAAPAEVEVVADDEARGLVGGPAEGGRGRGCRSRSCEHGPTVGVVQRRALAPDVRRPHRHPARARGSPPPAPAGAVGPARGTGRRRCWDRRPASCPAAVCGIVQRPGTSSHSSVTTQVMSVVPQMTSTSPASSAPATSCSAKASIVPPPSERRRRQPSAPPGRLSPGTIRGQPVDGVRRPRPTQGLVPAREVEQREAVMAVTVSMAPSPPRAWLATACAGQ